MSRKKTAPKDIYQIKVTLEDSKPPIWRRLLVPGDVDLGELHGIIQDAMGWTDSHLHQFIVGETYYGEPHPDDFVDVIDESTVTLAEVAPREKFKFRYEYDFGDDWMHQVLVEKIVPPEPGVPYPTCVKGKRRCPPEDCGGVWGYQGLLDALADPDHAEHDDMMEWTGGPIDPEEFDLDAVNRALEGYRR